MHSRRLVVALVVAGLVGLVGCGGGDRTGPTPSTTGRAGSTTSTAPGPAATTVPPDATSGPVGGPVPAGFGASSVTFVSLRTGWVLGTAPCSAPPCTSVLRTRDGGQTWVGIPAPETELSVSQPGGVRSIRFADADNGWAFGPDLWATHDGGAHWRRVDLPGIDTGSNVADVEAGAGKVHVAVIDTRGIVILSSPAGADTWQISPTVVPIGAGPVPQADLVLQGDTGWLVEVDRVVVAGARLTAGAWVPWSPPCADAGGSAVLAASTTTDLVAVCDEGEWNDRPRAVRAYTSSDGGTTFHQSDGAVPLTNTYAAASGEPGTVAAAGSPAGGGASIQATFDGGATWAAVRSEPAGAWRELGFTSPTQGVAVLGRGDEAIGPLFMTHDGGHTWTEVVFG